MLYHWYELGRAAFRPARAAADSCRLFFNPLNPLTHTPVGRSAVAACEVFERATRRYAKPEFGITHTHRGRDRGARHRGGRLADARSAASCTSSATSTRPAPPSNPRLLLVAPMSGHFATLLRGTVETFLPDHEVYITDWQDARDVPLSAGSFDLDDYIDTMADMFRFFGGDVHVFAVCQPSVPVLAANGADGGGRRSAACRCR